MTDEGRNRLLAVGAIVVAAGALTWLATGSIGENLVYYWSPSELRAAGDKAHGATVRLGGVVVPGSLDTSTPSRITFKVADSHAPTAVNVPVVSTETPPQMFREGIGVVVEGTMGKDEVFQSARLMVNHDNNYRAPGDGGTGEEWKQSLTRAE